MESIGLFEAKTHLSALVERAEKGESIMITKHGRPVAKLVPAESRLTKEALEETANRFRRLRRQIGLSREEIVSLIHEGRKY